MPPKSPWDCYISYVYSVFYVKIIISFIDVIAVSDPSSYKKVCVQYGYGCQQQLKCNIGGYKGNCALVWKCNKNICVKYGHAGSHKSHSSHSKGGRPHHDEPADELSDEELNEEAKEEASEDEDEQFDEDENLDQIEEESDEDEG